MTNNYDIFETSEEDNFEVSFEADLPLKLPNPFKNNPPCFIDSKSINLLIFDNLLFSLSPDFSYGGTAVRELLIKFLNNSSVSEDAKISLKLYLTGLKDAERMALAVKASAVEANRRLFYLWEIGANAGSGGPWSEIFKHSQKHSTLVFTDACSTFSAKQILLNDNNSGLIINANPLLSSILIDSSFAKAIAHEEYHHRDNHYKVMIDLLLSWLKENPKATQIDKLRIRELAERSIDCVANERLQISKLDTNINRFSQSYGRRLFCAALSSGDSITEKDGCFSIPLQTFEKTETQFSVSLDRKSTVKHIFKTLVKADSYIK